MVENTYNAFQGDHLGLKGRWSGIPCLLWRRAGNFFRAVVIVTVCGGWEGEIFVVR
jgi:hypothetical protein